MNTLIHLLHSLAKSEVYVKIDYCDPKNNFHQPFPKYLQNA